MNFTFDVEGRKIYSEIDFNSPEARWVRITPEMASLILEKMNLSNRKLKKASVTRFKKDIERSRWGMTGHSISFRWLDDDRKIQVLCDGQNRLHAIVAAQLDIVTLVVCQLPANSFEKTDHGTMRSAADSLFIRREESTEMLAATIRKVLRFGPKSLGFMQGGAITGGLQDEAINECLRLNPLIRKSVSFVNERIKPSLRDKSRFLDPSMAAAMHYLFSRSDEQCFWGARSDEFMIRVALGIELVDGTPMFVLNKALNINWASTRVAPMNHVAAYFIQAWNAFVSGRTVKKLALAENQAFPEILITK